nr:MAG TPA: arabinose operon regulatory protein [Caudoviricetes sp.]
MTKEEQLEKMKQAVEYYKNNTTESLSKVSKLYKTTPNTLKKYLNEFGVEVRNTFKAKKSNLDLALEELTNNNIDIIANKYKISIEVLEKSLNISRTELKKLSI